MATYKILYWQEIPSQIYVEDEADEITLPLSPAFAARIDQLAVERGLAGSDDYLNQWNWGEEQERPGSAEEVARALQAELEAQADW